MDLCKLLLHTKSSQWESQTICCLPQIQSEAVDLHWPQAFQRFAPPFAIQFLWTRRHLVLSVLFQISVGSFRFFCSGGASYAVATVTVAHVKALVTPSHKKGHTAWPTPNIVKMVSNRLTKWSQEVW